MNVDFAELGFTRVARNVKKTDQGEFSLPDTFDSKRLVGKWVRNDDGIQRAQHDEQIPGGWSMPGWSIWLHNGERCEKLFPSGKYTLMFRPKAQQQARNILYANVSANRLNAELQGKTAAGMENNDFGVMNNAQLAQAEGDAIQTFPLQREIKPTSTVDAVVEDQQTGDGPPRVKRR